MTPSTPPELTETLTALTTSLQLASAAITAPEFPTATPPPNGISLLDVKNELLLSYLHNLVFLVLVKLRSGPLDGAKEGGEVGSEAVKDLVKLRLLLEKGVRPLEAKLKYQIDKVVAAAVDAEVAAAGTVQPASGDEEDEDEDGVEHDDYGIYANKKTAAPAAPVSTLSNTELSFRPNPLALAKPAASALPASGEEAKDGLYRPPRISATAMPELSTRVDKEARKAERAGGKKSYMLDEFVADELSTAPVAEPSIGSTIVAGGRVTKSARERREEAERRDYEESNFVRLPQLSKKEMRERKRKGGDGEGQFGGEDWRSFAGDLDRLTKSAGREGGKSGRLLEKSRKRRGDDEVGGGRGLGENFERRRSKLESRAKKRKV